jgi:hypothetical protein
MDVSEILGPSSRTLVLDECATADDGDGKPSDLDLDPTLPGRLERKARDRGENVDPTGRYANLEDHLRLDEISYP